MPRTYVYDSVFDPIAQGRTIMGRCLIGITDSPTSMIGQLAITVGTIDTVLIPFDIMGANHSFSEDITITFEFTASGGSVVYNWAKHVRI